MVLYKTIVADPPWKVSAGRSLRGYAKRNGKQVFNVADDRARQLSYPALSVAQIKGLSVSSLAATDAHLYLWTINRYLRDAFDVAAAWGFVFSTLLTWAKNPIGGGLGGDAFGISTEFCLFCRRGNLPAQERMKTTWFNWKRPYKNGYPQHSAKPDGFFSLVEQISPSPRIELFSRKNRCGWDGWGDECPASVEIGIDKFPA